MQSAIISPMNCQNVRGCWIHYIVAFEVNGSPCIQVKDNGPGIAEAEIDNVFLPFYTTKSEGSGIGLNLSKQIMRAHKGKITLDSSTGSTTFTLVF